MKLGQGRLDSGCLAGCALGSASFASRRYNFKVYQLVSAGFQLETCFEAFKWRFRPSSFEERFDAFIKGSTTMFISFGGRFEAFMRRSCADVSGTNALPALSVRGWSCLPSQSDQKVSQSQSPLVACASIADATDISSIQSIAKHS